MQYIVSDTHIAVSLISDNCEFLIGSAECSKYHGASMMYFNRLYVKPMFREQGYGTILLKALLKLIKERNFGIQLDINPYGDMKYADLERFYTKHGFKKYKEDNGNFYTYYYNKEVSEMDISNFNVDKKNTATVVLEQTFWIGDADDVKVVVNLYENNDIYKLTSWLNGTEELNTVDYDGDVENEAEVLAAMEKLVHDNERYILDIASWDGE